MTCQIIGFGLFLIGCLHALFPTSQIESRVVRSLQALFDHKVFLYIFREIWFLGRTPFAVIVLGYLIILNWKPGLLAAGVFLLTVAVEQLFKRTFDRTRPFLASEDIDLLQPMEPADPSFPSGDALRIWYLAAVIPAFAGNGLPFLIAAISLATLITLGRMVLGVHYPTDTAGGAGLGLLGGGTAIWIASLLHII